MGLLRTVEQFSSTEELGANCTSSLRLLLCNISQNIGVNVLSSTIRAHFFGRLPHSSRDANNTITSRPKTSGVFMPMIQRDGSSNHMAAAQASSDEKPHLDIPMRISAAAIILCAVLPTRSDRETLDKALSDTLPIVMTLLDDVQSINQATGALLFVSVIEAAYSSKLTKTPSFVGQFSALLTSVFEGTLQMCGREDPTVLTMICLAQSKWVRYCEFLSNNADTANTPSQVHAMSRKATSDILVAIGKQSRVGGREGNDERLAGALVAGINPLLAQLAHLPKAACIEIARVGLATILPIIGWSGMSLEVRSAQIAALAGLLSLMDGAYPIMPRHGKKIMTELILLLDRTDKDATFLNKTKHNHEDDIVSTDATCKFTLLAAAVSLVTCGKSAETVLKYIESTHPSKDQLINRIQEIRTVFDKLRGNTH